MANVFDIGLLLRFLPFINQAKGHFMEAGREALLGIDKLLDVWVEEYPNTNSMPLQSLQPIINNLKDFVALIIKEIPDNQGKHFQGMKEAVIGSILDVLDEELEKTELMSQSDKKRHKLEALKAIKKVLIQELTSHSPEPSNNSDDEVADEPVVARTSNKITRLRTIHGR